MSRNDGRVVGTTKIVDAGDPRQRWNVVVMGDGYTSAQLGQFETDAKTFAGTLLQTSPFDRLRAAINVYRVDVESTDSGADDPVKCGGTGATPATYLDATYCTDGLDRLLSVNTATAMAVADEQVPQWHLIVVAVNSTKYGGSGGPLAVYSLAQDAVEIALHEMGHTVFGLADEYASRPGCGTADDAKFQHHPAGEPAAANVTLETDRTRLKWRDLVAASTPIPTTRNPDCATCDPRTGPPPGLPATVVGAFEGADQYHCDAFRPQFTCRMRELSEPFCAVCALRIRQILTPFLPTVLAATGRISFLRVHDVGTGFGPPSDQLDVEVVVQVDTEPGRSFGFQLRADDNEPARKGMLDTLRTAFNRNRLVRLDYRRTGLDNGILIRVADLP